MRVVCLGSGTSTGVPMIGCDCQVCMSTDSRNRRHRCSIVVDLPAGRLLIDTPPELRLACIEHDVKEIGAVLLTHTHSDHIMGMDDIRQFNFRTGAAIPVYAEPNFLEDLKRVFRYVFEPGQTGGGKPRLELREIEPFRPFTLLGSIIRPLKILHGALPITAFRMGSFAYVTDASDIPPETMEELRGLDTLILGAIRDRPHSTHFSIAEGLKIVEELRPRQTYFTHLTHDVEHGELAARLPSGVEPAYDGLTFDFTPEVG